jgi:hypothetical protein
VTKRITGLLPLPPEVAQMMTSLGLTDEDLITFDDFLLCAPRRRTREVLLTFVRFVVRRRDRHGVPGYRTKRTNTERRVRRCWVRGPRRCGNRLRRTRSPSLTGR